MPDPTLRTHYYGDGCDPPHWLSAALADPTFGHITDGPNIVIYSNPDYARRVFGPTDDDLERLMSHLAEGGHVCAPACARRVLTEGDTDE